MTFAAVRNGASEVLLVRRIDDGFWELPGGRIDVGESAQAVIREVADESGVTIALTGLSGVYSDPGASKQSEADVGAPRA